MESADRIMEECPDSALAILSDIDSTSLTGDEERARMALLMSMVLDKNYIDTTDFSVLQPAINYYLSKGNADDRLRTYYYQGRIYQNMGDDDGAMKSFVRGLDLGEEATDTLTLARMLVAQSFIFKSLSNFSEYVSNRLSAAELYGRLGHNELRTDCLLAALDGYILSDDRQHSDSIYALCSKEYQENSIDSRDFLPLQLSYEWNFGTKEQLLKLLGESTKITDWPSDRIMTIAGCYLACGESRIANEILNQLSMSGIPYDSMKYSAVKYAVLDSLNDYKGSLEELKTFIDLFSDEYKEILESRLQSSEIRHKFELESQKEAKDRTIQTTIWMSGISILIMLVILMLFIIRHNRMAKRLALREKRVAMEANEKLKDKSERLEQKNRQSALEVRDLKDRLQVAEAERDRLDKLLESQSHIPPEVKLAIKDRIRTLNDLLATQIKEQSNPKKGNQGKSFEETIQELVADRQKFMNSTRLAFMASHPSFIQYFEDHNLTTDEINYICLYAIGLNGKETGAYIQKSGHVNMSSTIRKKLGLDVHETNISIYVRRLLEEF